MNESMVCPKCGAAVIEDAWEDIVENESGNFTLDGFQAYVCKQKCGYVERIDAEEK
jgi:ribosomal protein S27AE